MNEKIFSYLVLSALLILSFGGCDKQEIEWPFAQLTTKLISIEEGGIEVQGIIQFLPSSDPILEYGFIYGETPGANVFPDNVFDTDTLVLGTQPPGNSFSVRIERELAMGVEYYVRAYLKSATWISYGTDVIFTSR